MSGGAGHGGISDGGRGGRNSGLRGVIRTKWAPISERHGLWGGVQRVDRKGHFKNCRGGFRERRVLIGMGTCSLDPSITSAPLLVLCLGIGRSRGQRVDQVTTRFEYSAHLPWRSLCALSPPPLKSPLCPLHCRFPASSLQNANTGSHTMDNLLSFLKGHTFRNSNILVQIIGYPETEPPPSEIVDPLINWRRGCFSGVPG